MRKQGPCCHCGAKETPLWRNGPLEKPVLCNACGSRWRIRGTLENYVPKRGHGGGRRRSRKMGYVIHDVNVDKTIPTSTIGTERAIGKGKNTSTSCAMNANRTSESEICTINRSTSESVTSDSQKIIFHIVIKSEDEEDDDDGITDSGKDEGPSEADNEVPSPTGAFAHIKSLHRELLKLYIEEKSSMDEEEEAVLIDNVNSFMYENEIMYGSYLLKPPLPNISPTEEAALKGSASSSSSVNQLDAKEETPPLVVAGSMDKVQTRSASHTPANIAEFPDQEALDDESIAEMFFPHASFASDGDH
ncbi:GATA transcription factor 27-like [Punica granatum]|uniref:GATA transcription factor 27-like n=1 Tax=Punica granatum TaxID=22663 RepID=A0A6P8CUY9_PUNGR|nr:GATA transcription factor 27-like [Punica granatum]